VVSEAATCLAIVASSVVGAASELVVDHVNGRIFPSGDLKGLIDALLEVTDPARVEVMKAASPPILDAWRRRADPIAGLRKALQSVNCISEDSAGVSG
jgi:hypothetical protein